MATETKQMFRRAKKLALMGRQEEARDKALAVVGKLERLLEKDSSRKGTHEELFEVYFFIGDRENARNHLHIYIELERRSISDLYKDEEIRVYGCRFREAYLKGKEHWLHLLATGGLTACLQDMTHRPYIWAFDLDGTLLQMGCFSWDMIDQELGTERLNKEMYKIYKAGKDDMWQILSYV